MQKTNNIGFSIDDDQEDERLQLCPQCGYRIGNVAGTKEAICNNCGFKDPCCE